MGMGAKPIQSGGGGGGGHGGGGPLPVRALKAVGRNSGVRGVLNVLDGPRAIIESGAHQLVNGRWDQKEFLADARAHKGLATYAKENHPEGWAKLPTWAQIGAGFLGDAALDPTSYVSFGASAAVEGAARTGAKLGWKEVAERLAVEAGKEADPVAKAALEESVARVSARRAATAADKQLLERVGVETGGSIGAFGHRVKLPFGDAVVAGKAATTGRAIAGIAESKPGEWLRKRFMGGEYVDQLKANPAAAFRGKAASRTARGLAGGLSDEAKVELNDLRNKYKGWIAHDPTFSEHMVRVIEAPSLIKDVPVELRPAVRAAARDYSDWLESVAARGEALGGVDINRLADYFPHQLTEDGRNLVKGSAGKEGFMRQRKLEGTLEELTAAGKEALGKDYQDIWRKDPWEVGVRYADSVGRSVGANHAASQLKDWGDVVTSFPKVEKRAAGAARKAAKLARGAEATQAEAAALKASLGVDPAELAKLTAGADAAKTEAMGAGARATELEAEKAALDAVPEGKVRVYRGEGPNQVKDGKWVTEDRALAERYAGKGGVVRQLDVDPSELMPAADATRPTEWALASGASAKAPVVPQEALDALETAKGTLKEHTTALGSLAGGHVDPTPIAQEGVKLQEQIAHLDRVMKGEFPPSSLGEGWTTPKVEKARAELKAQLADVQERFKSAKAARQSWETARTAVEARVATAKAEVVKAQVAVDAATAARPEHFTDAVSANAERLTQIDTELAQAKGLRAAKLTEEKQLRQQAAQLASRAQAEVEPTMAEIGRLTALASQQEAEALTAAGRAAKANQRLLDLKPDVRKAELDKMLKAGWKELQNRPGHYAAEQTAEHLAEMVRWQADVGSEHFWKVFDSIQSRWKAQSLLSPGFHVRNFMGGIFNNSLAGVGASSYYDFGVGYAQYLKGGLPAVKNESVATTLQNMLDYGVLEAAGRDFSDVAERDVMRQGVGHYAASKLGLDGSQLDRWDPTSLDFKGYEANHAAGQHVETMLRGVMFHDSLAQGLTAEEALGRIAKYHFDYSDLSPWERKYAKRAIPFYTWTRKNLPLQLEHMASTPGAYTRYEHVRRNVEAQSSPDGVVPSYFNELMAMRWFRKTKGGDSMYLAPDLPYIGLEETVNLRQLTSQLSPAVKTPIQSLTGVNLYTGAPMSTKQTEVPTSWKWFMPALAQFSGLPGVPAVHKTDGKYTMSAREAQKIEDFLPILGRTRRLLPSEPKYQQRALTSALSFWFGINARTLDGETINGELARRAHSR